MCKYILRARRTGCQRPGPLDLGGGGLDASKRVMSHVGRPPDRFRRLTRSQQPVSEDPFTIVTRPVVEVLAAPGRSRMRIAVLVLICNRPADGDASVLWRFRIEPPGEGIKIRSLPNGRIVFPTETAVRFVVYLVYLEDHLRAELVVPVAGDLCRINRVGYDFRNVVVLVDLVAWKRVSLVSTTFPMSLRLCYAPSVTKTCLTEPETGVGTFTSSCQEWCQLSIQGNKGNCKAHPTSTRLESWMTFLVSADTKPFLISRLTTNRVTHPDSFFYLDLHLYNSTRLGGSNVLRVRHDEKLGTGEYGYRT